MPNRLKLVAIGLACIAALLLALTPDETANDPKPSHAPQ
jgi:hypothetical protein